MDIITYDLAKLAENDVINTSVATRFFYTMQDYFDKLTEFTQHYHSYINHYNPTVVVVSDAERNIFIAACATVRALLTQLGMSSPLNELNNLENAALAGSIEELSDGMIKFHGMLEIAATHIEAARKAPGTGLEKKKVMLVHDDKTTLKSVAAMLKDHYTVISELNGSDAIASLNSHTPEAFVIFTEMEGICGYQLAFYLKQHELFGHTPIIFLVESVSRNEGHKVLPFNELDYIFLPVKKDTLLQKIENAISI
jgi:CheY-like chemotaxis protein